MCIRDSLRPVQLWIGIARRQISLEEVHTECRAQIIRLFDAGITPTHLDGHLHVHVLPRLSPLVIALAREFCIRNVRSPAEDLEATLPLLLKIGGARLGVFRRSAIAFGVSSLARRLRERLRIAGLVCPDAFLGLAHTGFLDAKTLTALLALIPNGTTELMCHPGYASAQAESLGGGLTREREAEVLALTAPKCEEVLRTLGIRLINQRDLEEHTGD